MIRFPKSGTHSPEFHLCGFLLPRLGISLVVMPPSRTYYHGAVVVCRGNNLTSLSRPMSEIGTPEDSGNRRRVLLADDHPLVLERVTRFLQPTFDVVGVAHNGLEMVLEAMRLSPEVIVADISMPGLDGLAAVRQLREMGSGATIVFLTIHEGPELVDACLAEGALGFVLKSHMKTDLIPAINVALSGRCFVSSPRHANT